MTPDALKVATDILRELGREQEARWLEHPEAVRELLKAPMCHCAVPFDDLSDIHNRTCSVTAAWRVLGDPRGTADVERAWDEALQEQRRRARALRMADTTPATSREVRLADTQLGKIAQVEQLISLGYIGPEQARQMLATTSRRVVIAGPPR